mmetsp:Transcript_14814/g.21185  ORF Transcript_14814/g.21185 Transcript_14814/m.21185 type:complete len:470 (+) Transcript_14814:142-1551(+)|eukprot:CAMPEP_0184868206 /NCGR_PEP_ID=MMETSP0580-20130426/29559_1 /TAXON_ID=1118495 /ORGANISM="Dactyliosolen fragilissimus" /LENGTH=469 /DNA_ID=CAMNT_0027368955 /DNA_START=121 /DNA_END=1530 /DNA_ORIENTATION=+
MTKSDNMDVDEIKPPPPSSSSSQPAAKSKKKNANVTPSAGAEEASKYPDMSLAQSIHKLTMMANASLSSSSSSSTLSLSDATAIGIPSNLNATVMETVGGGNEMENPSLYKHLCSVLSWDKQLQSSSMKGEDSKSELIQSHIPLLSESDLIAMEERHETKMKELEQKVEEAKENSGDMEVLDARFEVARFAAKSLSKDQALEAYEKVLALPKLSSGKTLDVLMESARVASFYGDKKKNKEFLEKISKMKDGGDWDRRNRLKVYNALAKFLARDVKTAASLLIDCIATFSCTEICSYKEFIVYTIISNILYLPRTELKSKIIDGPEILSIVTEIPTVYKLVNSLYECNYNEYLQAMVDLQPILVADRYLQPHTGYILRELHVLGYKQFLDSYKSVTLESMAKSFGVGTDFLDLQLSRFIAAGRLTAKIDKFGGVVETNRPDLKNAQYRDMIQQGDLLLNRIQKLARVVDL